MRPDLRDRTRGVRRPAFVNGFVHGRTFSRDDLARIHEQRDADMVFVTASQLAALYRKAANVRPREAELEKRVPK